MLFRLNLSLRFLCSLALLFIALSSLEISPQRVSAKDETEPSTLKHRYGKLPLSFEPNRGQANPTTQYIARGQGYSISLMPDGALLQLQTARKKDQRVESLAERQLLAPSVRLKMNFVGAKPTSPIAGKKLAAKSNYLTGRDSRNWLTGVPNFAEVSYPAIYPGVDLVYHGNQRQLEYDFVVAPGADPHLIRFAFDGAESIRINETGELVLRASGVELVQQKPVVYQEIDGQRRLIRAEYLLHRQQVGFRIGNYDRKKTLIIDPVIVYSTVFGGSGTDQIWSLAVDSIGNAYIAGDTTSDFLAPSPIQNGRAASADVFVAKLAPDGSTLLQATYLGGINYDSASGVRVDGAGNIYLTGVTSSTDFPVTANAVQGSLAGVSDAFLAKINANGSSLAYATYLGGASFDVGIGLAVDATGNAYVTGRTDSTSFAVPGALNSKSGVALSKSANSAGDWTPSANGLERSTVRCLAIDPANSNTIYAGTDNGIFKTTDGGASWQLTGLSGGNATQPSVAAIAIDPSAPSTIYAGTTTGILKSADGGNTYQVKGSLSFINTIAINPASPQTVYAGGGAGAFKSTNSGESWTPISRLSFVSVNKIVIDPLSPTTVYAATGTGIFKTANDGALWNPTNLGISPNPFGTPPPIISLEIANASPQTLFAGVQNGLFKTINGGDLWELTRNGLTTISGGLLLGLTPNAIAIDPINPLVAYVGTFAGVYKTTDGGSNWQPSSAGLKSQSVNALAIDRMTPATIYTASASGGDAFVAKLNPAGTALSYLRFVGGDEFDEGDAIGVDSGGNVFITGRTNSANFPTANALQSQAGGLGDAFVTKLNAAGAISFSTYLGGNRPDQSLGIAVGNDGSAYLTGFTSSANFPLINALKSTIGLSPDAFVARIKADGSGLEFSTFLGGSNSDAGYTIAVDGAGNVLVAGVTFSSDFPAILASQSTINGTPDAFVSKLSGNGSQLLFSTYLGGNGEDRATGIGTDAAGNVYVAGITNSFNFPTVPPSNPQSGANGFIAKFSLAPDLVLTMTDSPDPVSLGRDLTYTMTLTNSGEIPATGVKLSDTLPAGATLVSATASQGGCAGTATINCELGVVNVGATVTVTLVIKPPVTRTITNTATVTANEPDLRLANNTASQTTTVDFADTAVTITELNQTVKIGAAIAYAIKVTNRSGAAATNVTVTDALPGQLTFVSCSSADGGVCGGAGNARTITFASLAVGETKHAVILATVNNAVADGTTISNSVTVAQSLVDPDQANNAASATITAVTNPLRVKNNGKVAFANGILTTVEAAGGRYQTFPYTCIYPVYSPDGSRIAFIGGPLGDQNNSSLGVFTLNGGSYVRLTSSAQFNRPTWSPDSLKLAFVRSGKEVWIINRDGTGEAKLFTSPGEITDLEWSPDGTRLAYVRSGGIHVANLDGSGETRLTNYPGAESTPRWSPDGSQLLFTRQRSAPQPAIYRMNADGSDLQRLLNEETGAINANWSPDGTKIVYELNLKLYSINIDGTSPVNLTISRNASQPHWQPLPTETPLVPQPAPRTYSISGRLALGNGAPASVDVNLTGTRKGKVKADADGYYDFGNLPEGAQATITPASIDYTFDPISHSLDNLRQNQTLNFVAAPTNFAVTGRVTDPSGAPIERVEIQISANISYPGPLVVVTDKDGKFSFSGLSVRGNYVFSPRASFVSSFAPETFTISPNVVSRVINFVGVRKTVGISGKVTDTVGNPISGVTIAAHGGNSTAAVTDADGNYTLPNLVGGLDYTLSAFNPALTFAPESFPISVLSGIHTVNFFAGASQVTGVSAASFSQKPVAPESIVAAFGSNFSTETQVATTLPLPTSLADTSVTIQDRNFVERAASLFFVSPGQINLMIPTGTAEGDALMLVKNKNRTVAAGVVRVAKLSPSLFTANATGQGVPAALVYRQLVTSVVYEPVSRFDLARNEYVPIPIDIGPLIAPQPFLILFGTGLRAASVGGNPQERFATIGGVNAMIHGLGAQGTFAGLDQVNVEIPRSLAGRGEVDLVLTIDGKTTNTVRVAFK